MAMQKPMWHLRRLGYDPTNKIVISNIKKKSKGIQTIDELLDYECNLITVDFIFWNG